MSEMKNFKTEYQTFLQQYPYQTIEIDGVKTRYQYGGKEGAPVILFFHELEMQEAWMPYALHFCENYQFLIYEYPLQISNVDEQLAFTLALLKKLAIRQVKMKLLLKKCQGFLDCETPDDQAYGMSFYETVASDLHYKYRFMHSVKCVDQLKNYPVFVPADFEYLRGKIQVLIPEHDIFTKEDQERMVALFQKLDTQIESAPGEHVGFVVWADDYLEKMDRFLEG